MEFSASFFNGRLGFQLFFLLNLLILLNQMFFLQKKVNQIVGFDHQPFFVIDHGLTLTQSNCRVFGAAQGGANGSTGDARQHHGHLVSRSPAKWFDSPLFYCFLGRM